jgi:hypothetical protein
LSSTLFSLAWWGVIVALQRKLVCQEEKVARKESRQFAMQAKQDENRTRKKRLETWQAQIAISRRVAKTLHKFRSFHWWHHHEYWWKADDAILIKEQFRFCPKAVLCC